MPSRGSRAWKARTTLNAQSTPARPRLTKEQLQDLAQKMQKHFQWDSEPKDFQLEAVQAQIEGVDMIVQVPTGSGKTAIAAGPHLWPGNEGKFTLMVCPLLSLEEEMVCAPSQLYDSGVQATHSTYRYRHSILTSD